MQGRNWILLAVAAVIGILAVIVANTWFSGMEQEHEEALSTVREHETVDIVVATQPLEYGSALTPQNTELRAWPASSVPAGAFVSIDQALQHNRVAIRPIVPGEPVLADKVSGEDGRATLAALLPPGMRAVSVPVDAIRGVSGFVLPGSSVDVILTRRSGGPGSASDDVRSDVILENVQVLAVDQSSNDREGEPQVGQTATLAVSLVDAQRLAVAEGLGTVSLALRKVENDIATDGEEGTAPAIATVTAADVGGRVSRITTPQSVPVRARFIPADDARPIPATAAQPPAPSGPRMEIVRGTQSTTYPVSRSGSY